MFHLYSNVFLVRYLSSEKEKSGVMPGKGSDVLSVNVIPDNESVVLKGEESTVITGEECGVLPVR